MSGLVIPTAGTIGGAASSARLTTPDTGAQVAKFGDQLFRIGTALETDRLHRQLGEARVQMMQGLTDLRQKYAAEGNPDQIDHGFQTDSAALKEQIVGNLDPKIRDQGSLLFDQLATTDAAALGSRALALRQSQKRAIADQTYHATTQAAATADPATLDNYVNQTKAYYGQLVTEGVYTPEQAQKIVAGMPVAIETSQANALLASDPQGLIKKIDAGDFKYLNPNDVTRIRARAEHAVAQVQSAQTHQNGDILKQATAVINAGRSWSANGMTEADLEANPAMKANPAYPAFEQAVALRTYMPKFTSLPLAQQQQALADEQKKAASAPYNLKIAAAMKASIAAARKGYSADPLTYAAHVGVIQNFSPLPDPASTPDAAMVAALKVRGQTADYLTKNGYTRTDTFFTPEEKATWSTAVAKNSDPALRARLAEDLAQAFGGGAAAAATEIKADPVFTWVGGMLAHQGNMQTAQEIFQGQRAIANKDVQLPPVSARRADYFGNFKDLFDPAIGPGGQPMGADESTLRNQVLAAADALYAYRTRDALKPSSNATKTAAPKIDTALYKQSLHEVLGGTGTVDTAAATGGLAKVAGTETLIPPGIHGSDVQTAFNQLWTDLNGGGFLGLFGKDKTVTDQTWRDISTSGNAPMVGGHPLDATTLGHLHLRAIGGNAYVLQDSSPGAQNAPVYGADHKPYIIDITKMMQEFGPDANRSAPAAPSTAEPSYYKGVSAAAPGSLAPGMPAYSVSDTGEHMSNATGTFTGKYTQYGRKLWQSPDGSVYSERTITAQAKDGKWYNVPTVAANGQILPEQQVSDWLWGQTDPKDPVTGRPLQPFDDLKTAVSAAQKRSAGMDIGSLGKSKGAKP